jgi:NAD(P)H-dependent FMN reductase
VTPQWRLLDATKRLLGCARATHEDLEVELINLADKQVGKKVGIIDGRTAEQYLEDSAQLIRSVHAADGVIIASSLNRRSFAATLKVLTDHLPIVSLAGKPVGIVAMSDNPHDFLAVEWHLDEVLAWLGARTVQSVYLVSADFVDSRLSDAAQQDLEELGEAVIKLKEPVQTPSAFLEPRTHAGDRN